MAGFYSKLEVIFFFKSSLGLANRKGQSILLSNIKRVMCLLAVVFSDKRGVSRAFLLSPYLPPAKVARVAFDSFIRSFSHLFLYSSYSDSERVFCDSCPCLQVNRAYVTRTRRPCAQEKNFQPVTDSRLAGAAPPTSTATTLALPFPVQDQCASVLEFYVQEQT
jgi:hypothetical protein